MEKSLILCCWALAVALLPCGTTGATETTGTTVPKAWRSPDYSGPGLSHILVIGVVEDDAKRRLFEDHLAQELARTGVFAVPSYAHLPNTDVHSKEAIREVVVSGNYDAVTITRLVGEGEVETYVPGRAYETARTPEGGYYGYYRTSWEVVHEPGYYETNTTLILETSLYDVESKSLVWHGESDTMRAKSVAETIDSASRAIASQIAQDGMLAGDSAALAPAPRPGAPEAVETVPVARKRLFPLFADKLGVAPGQLPNAYGIGMIGYWQKQDLIVKDVTIQIDDGPVKELDFLEFEDPFVKTNVAQVRADLWVLPFLNVAVMGGMLAGDATLPLAIEGRGLAEYFDLDVCDGVPPELPFCSRRLETIGSTQYTGWNFGIGAVLAGGWRNFIIAVPANYVWSWVSILQQTVTAVTVSPRAGYVFNLGRFGVLTAYTGATYLKADIAVELTMKFDTTGNEIGLGDETELDATVFQGNKDRWNMLVGGNWEIRKWVSLHCEGGFLGSRTNVAGSLTFRF